MFSTGLNESFNEQPFDEGPCSQSGVFAQFFADMAYDEQERPRDYDRFGRLTNKKKSGNFLEKLKEFEADAENAVFDESRIFDDHPDRLSFSNNSCDLFITHENTRKPAKVVVNQYLLGKTIGRGSYGKVKDCIDLTTLRRHAMKIVTKQGVRKIPGGWAQAIHEALIMKNLIPHPNLVRVVTSLRLANPDRVCIVMENCLGSIHDLQASGVPLGGSISEDRIHSNCENSLMPSDIYQDDPSLMRDPDRRLSIQRISTEPLFADTLEERDYAYFHPPGMLSLEPGRNVVKNRKISHFDLPTRWMRRDSSPSGVQQFRRLPEAQAHAYFLQILNGISYLHSQRIIHRDIKPGNMLLVAAPGCGLDPLGYNSFQSTSLFNSLFSGPTQNRWSFSDILRLSRGYLVKLTDFGVSASLPFDQQTNMVSGGQMTPAIQPPEVAKGTASLFDGPKLDIYSAGVSLFFMLVGQVPFSCSNVLKMFDLIAKGSYTIPGYVSVNACELIRGMMHNDPEKRFSSREVAQHKWLQNTPRSQPTVRQGLEFFHKYWTRRLSSNMSSPVSPSTGFLESIDSNSNSRLPRGIPIWLDPLVYLARPTPTFPAPHIDETGARIFSKNECEVLLCTDDDGSVAVQTEEWMSPRWLSESVAPISVLPRLKAFYNWPPSDNSDQEDPLDEPCRPMFSKAFNNSNRRGQTTLSSPTPPQPARDHFWLPSEPMQGLRVTTTTTTGNTTPGVANFFAEENEEEQAIPRSNRHRVFSANFVFEQKPPTCDQLDGGSETISADVFNMHQRASSISAWTRVTCDAPRQRHFSLVDAQTNALKPPDCPDDIPIANASDKQSSSVLTLNSLTAPQLVKLASQYNDRSESTVALGVRTSQNSLNSGNRSISRPGSRAGTSAGQSSSRVHTNSSSSQKHMPFPYPSSPPVVRKEIGEVTSNRCSFQIGEEEDDVIKPTTSSASASSKVEEATLVLTAANAGPAPGGKSNKGGRRLTNMFVNLGKRIHNKLHIK